MLNPGTLLGKYKLLARLGAGGMGEVYLAKDSVLDRQIAIKVLPADVTSDESRMRRFVQEAKAAASLNHPNIAHVYEVGEANGVHFIAMEYVDGETLSTYIRRPERDLNKVLNYLQSVAEALSKAHTVGIVHRDLKPDNIMISRDDHVKVLDFGLAKLVEPQGPFSSNTSSEIATAPLAQLSTSGLVIGTAGYMSPEQAQGKTREIDHRTDIFSFGCILYEAITGVKAFAGKDALDSLHKIVHQATPVIKEQTPEAPSELQRILRRCLAKDRDERYQTMKDVAIELKELRRDLEGRTESSETEADHDKQTQAFAKKTASLTNATHNFLRPKFVVIGLLLIATVLAVFLYRRQTANVAAIDSIAVLPFANQNNDANVEYLCDGLTESIINSLAKLPHLRVVSRSSVFQFKNKQVDPVAAGKQLGVGAVLTGRLSQRGDDLLISVELIDVHDNKQLWGDQYSQSALNLLSTQRRIASEITNSLQLKLSGADVNKVAKNFTENDEAYQLYLKGRYYWNKRTEEGATKAIEYYTEAIRKDPAYALAYTGLADAYCSLGFSFDVGSLPPNEAMPKAKAAALRALELDSSLSEAHTSLAMINLLFDWDWAHAEQEFKRAIELDPNNTNAHHWYSHLLLPMGRVDESLLESQRALQNAPLDLIINVHLGWHYLYSRQYKSAVDQLNKTLEMDPNYTVARRYLGLTYEQTGQHQEALKALQTALESVKKNSAIEAEVGHALAISNNKAEAQRVLDRLLALSKERFVSSYDIAHIYVGLGDHDKAFFWLEKALNERDDLLVYLKADPRMDPLHSDPRFSKLVQKIGLP